MSKPDTISEKTLLKDHVTYELEMLAHTFEYMQKHNWDFPYPVGNSLVEAFCVHARNLVYFFEGSHGSDAALYTNANYQRPVFQKDLITKLHTQIAHLTLKRTDNSTEKLHAGPQHSLLIALLNAVEIFEQRLLPEFQDVWKPKEIPKASHFQTLPIKSFLATSTASATNSISVASTIAGKI